MRLELWSNRELEAWQAKTKHENKYVLIPIKGIMRISTLGIAIE